MQEKKFATEYGQITYWTNDFTPERRTLIFLPGLTATHILFEKQIEYFEDKYNILMWDAPGHGASRPFELKFTMEDMARYLKDILESENIEKPVLVGQSMGGYVSQMFMELFPGKAGAFISIDSCSLKRETVTWFDIWALRRVEPLYKMYKWEKLLEAGSKGCAETEYGQKLMRTMMESFDKDSYCKMAAHGYKCLADCLASNIKFDLDCPTLLICGTKDKAGSAKRYNKKWSRITGIPVTWIENAGHNSNSDKADEINKLIENFLTTELKG